MRSPIRVHVLEEDKKTIRGFDFELVRLVSKTVNGVATHGVIRYYKDFNDSMTHEDPIYELVDLDLLVYVKDRVDE